MTSPGFPIPAKMAKQGAHAGPVRVELRTFSPEEIRQFNAEHRYGTAAWDEDAELLANRIRLLKHVDSISISLDQLRRWASHPDERVRLALLRSEILWFAPHHRSAREIAAIVAAVDARLRPEEEAWDPMLDVFACRPWEIWPLAEQNYRRSGRRPTRSNGGLGAQHDASVI